MTDVIDRYLQEISTHRTESTCRNDNIHSKPLRVFFGQIRITDITTQHVYRYRDMRRTPPVSANRELSLLPQKMRVAITTGVLEDRFCEHDLRANTGRDTDLDHTVELLGHSNAKVTKDHYRRKTAVVKPLR